MLTRTPLVLLALGTTLSLSACGSSGLARADLAKKADAICATAGAAALKIVPPSDLGQANSDPATASKYLAAIQPISAKESKDLAALKPDKDAKADWDALVANENKISDFLDATLAKAKAKDPSGIADLQKSGAIAQPFIDAANKIGAKGCATS